MDPRELRAASKYVNNLLASRGLLRGKEIPFHRPTDDDSTPSKIINLVHELLARRDKEEDQREALALTLRTLRTAEETQTATITTLKTKVADLERKNALLESANRASTTSLRTAESANRHHKDEAARAKTALAQVRTQCANDIRKRDVQIQKLKERLSDTRGRGQKPPMAQLTVIGAPPNLASSLAAARVTAPEEEAAPLAQETADFLTKLSQELADENDNLIALIRTTLSTLKTIQGLPDEDQFVPPDVELEGDEGANPVIAPPASFDDLTADLDNVLYALKEVLNQPNYVPLEELAEREAEIERLVTKNKTLEEEWRKALELVDGWNRAMGAKFAEVTQKDESTEVVKTPGKGKGKGKALVEIVREAEGAGEELEEEVEVIMGRNLSMVVEEEEEEEEEEEAEEELEELEEAEEEAEVKEVEEEAEEEEEEEAIVVEQEHEVEIEDVHMSEVPPKSSVKKKGKRTRNPEPSPEPIAEPTDHERHRESTPEPQLTPAKKNRKQKAKSTTKFTPRTERTSTAEAAEEEAAVEEQIMAEVRSTPVKVPTKPPAKTPSETAAKATAKSTAKTGKRKSVRISEAAPEMFEPKPVTTEAEDTQPEETIGATPARKRRVSRKGVTPGAPGATPGRKLQEPAVEGVVEKSQASSAKSGRKKVARKDDDIPDVVPEPVEEAVEEAVRVPISPVKRDLKRKAKDTLELDGETAHESAVVEEAPRGRKRRDRRGRGDVTMEVELTTAEAAPEAEMVAEPQPEEAPRGRERRRRGRKEDVTMEAEVSQMDTTAAQEEDTIPGAEPPQRLALKKRDRKRRPSAARTDMDELLELALFNSVPLPEPEPEEEDPEVEVIEEVSKPKSSRRSRASKTQKEDESMAEDTFARYAAQDESVAEEAPATKGKKTRRSRSSARKDLDDSALLDELSAEPVPVRYEEVEHAVRVVSLRDEEAAEELKEGKEKLSRARRRSLRNRDKHPIVPKAAAASPAAKRPAKSPGKPAKSPGKQVRTSARKRGNSSAADGQVSFAS